MGGGSAKEYELSGHSQDSTPTNMQIEKVSERSAIAQVGRHRSDPDDVGQIW